jgi:caffeoyl-CoA O-methyltransferase
MYRSFRFTEDRRENMKWQISVVGMMLSVAALGLAQKPLGNILTPSTRVAAQAPGEKKILSELEQMVKSHQTYLSVPVEDGKALRLLTEAADAKQVVEIGTSTGYSGLWFSLALERAHGHLTTFEIDHQRASRAHEHFRRADVEKLITVVEGNAHQEVMRLKGPIDVAFIDADKEGYVDYLNKILPLIRPGGLILAHNIDRVVVRKNYVRSDVGCAAGSH